MPTPRTSRCLKPAKKSSSRPREQSARKTQSGGRISAACEACKKRKTKCSGHPPPCRMCKQLDTPCAIDLTLDMRRRTAIQRITEESRALQDNWNELIRILRRGDGSKIEAFVRQIQQSSDDEDLVKMLHSRMEEDPKNDGQNLDGQITGKKYDVWISGTEKGEKRAEPSKRPFQMSSRLSRKRSYSTQEDGDSLTPTDHVSSGSVRNQEDESYESRHFRDPSVQTRPRSQQKTSSESSPNDRTDWDPSLQSAKSEQQTPIANTFLKNHWSDQSSQDASQSYSRSRSRKLDSGSRTAITSMTSVSEMCLPSLNMSNASEEVQTHPAIYEAMRVHKTSQVLELFGSLQFIGESGSRAYPISPEKLNIQSSATIPMHLVQSRLVLGDSPLSKVFTGFRDAARQMIATGTPAADIVAGGDVVLDLLFRDRCHTDNFTCSSWASEVCRNFGEIDGFVRIACIFLLTRLMRWMVYPTSKTYAELPDCQRPTPTQRCVPHVPAIDLHPVPAMRDMLCNRLQDWMSNMTQTGISCNWPFLMSDVLEADAATGSMRVSKLFGDHISKSENWSFGANALVLYPDLKGKIRIEDA